MKRQHLTPEEYHALAFDPQKLPDVAAAGYVSASVLSKSRNPLTFLLGPIEQKQTEDMKWGSLIDCLWTEPPEAFQRRYVVLPEDAPQRPTAAMLEAKKPSESSLARQQWWAEWDARALGKECISHAMFLEARGAVSMLNQNYLAKSILDVSERQVALVGDNPFLAGTKAKCLFDLLPQGGPFVNAIVDLKTTNDLSDYATTNIAWRFDYVVKMAFYGMLATAAGLGTRHRGILIWQRSCYPWDCKVREISQDDLDIGCEVVQRRLEALETLDASRLSDHFDTTLQTMSLADWQRAEYLR